MYRMMYKSYGIGEQEKPHYIEKVKTLEDVSEFLRLRESLATNMGYNTKMTKDTLEIYDNNKQIGKYYAE